METWYRTGGYGKNLIEPVTVVKATEKTVVVRERWNGLDCDSRAAIQSDWRCYFKTWDEARAHLIVSAEAKVADARLALERANGHLGNVRGLKNLKKPA